MAEIALFTVLLLFPLSGLMLLRARHLSQQTTYRIKRFQEAYNRIQRGGRKVWRPR